MTEVNWIKTPGKSGRIRTETHEGSAAGIQIISSWSIYEEQTSGTPERRRVGRVVDLQRGEARPSNHRDAFQEPAFTPDLTGADCWGHIVHGPRDDRMFLDL